MNHADIKKLFDGFGADIAKDDVWQVQSATVIKHKALERLAHCRLGEVQAGGSTADGQLLADDPEGAQQVPVEAVVEQTVGHGRAR